MSAPIPYLPSKQPVFDDVSFNGAVFKTVFWSVPKGTQVKGRILFVHGFSDYYKTHTKFFDKISQDGYEVFTYDQRGAGFTSPGTLKGLTDEFHSFNDLDHFIESNLKEMKSLGRDLFLVGHSMGGGIVLNYGVKGKYKDQVRGIVGVAPLILLHSSTKPWPLTVKFLEFLLLFMPNMKYESVMKSQYLTSDPAWREYFDKDEIINPPFLTLRQGYDFIKRGERLVDVDFIKDWDPKIPTLLIHGDNDRVNQPEGSQLFVDLLVKTKPGVDASYVGIVDARHSLFSEKEEIFQQVYDTFKQWVGKH
ncbi:hypothetical protein WICPIJ_007349 [Wickerhamomyces pijperi]|uniref:Serine aminopeptidase S33 domain-containing protein n=1 Tax=Wickerhamomyces pijperi TaxID=599730 RepID=A0A9P8TK58_WICPI|nr:hypothetical protein WICPIJ_007349 [Wickerhamomyces pijperi]